MKKVSFILILVLTAWVFPACNDSKKEDAGADTSGIVATVNDDDKAFAVKAFENSVNVLEITFAIQDKLVNPKVKSLAALLLKERGQINTDLLGITKVKSIATSPTLSVEAQTTADELSQKTGSELDKTYVNAMLEEYKRAAEIFENGADDTDDHELKAFAQKNLLEIKKQLDEINTIHDGMK